MELYLTLATAFLVGSLHAFEPDHMAAVTSFAVRRPGRLKALGFGLRWAAGHGGVVLLVGAVAILVGTGLGAGGAPDSSDAGRWLPGDGSAGAWLERLVGVSLIALGAWNLVSWRSLHVHDHSHADGVRHAHLHSHAGGGSHDHGHAITAFGALHGLAGTAPVLALGAMMRLPTPSLRIAFLLLFAVGTVVGMGIYALFAGWLAERVASRSAGFARRLAACAGAITLAIGFVWLLR